MRNPRNETLGFTQNDRHPGLVPGATGPRIRRAEGRVAPWTPGQARGDGLGLAKRWQAQRYGQILPVRIVAFDQILLPVALPFFEPFFRCDRGLHGVSHLEPNKTDNPVPFGEAIEHPVSVLENPSNQIRRNADIQRAVETAGQDIHARLSFSHFSNPRHPGLVPGSTVPLDRRTQNLRHGGPRHKAGVTKRGGDGR